MNPNNTGKVIMPRMPGLLLVLLSSIAAPGCFSSNPEFVGHEPIEFNLKYPWYGEGISCRSPTDPFWFSGTPICPEGNPDNILYAGWTLEGEVYQDGQCGYADFQPNAHFYAIEYQINPDVEKYDYSEASICILERSRAELYHCERGENECVCLFSFTFSQMKSVEQNVQECIDENPAKIRESES
ncbi:MAG TPA: hypothetical protein DEA96_18515 [Leptospiraceae bacterium]|nr:hypothetical protein [Spirochaetaceae bacterium]HBS06971.1 hypothetical protein [Leptospiraceae bacterium]|tara:strand:+ start:616 stop:1170 length:555 start_codon:yes stop_codon:yes gene_type:complete